MAEREKRSPGDWWWVPVSLLAAGVIAGWIVDAGDGALMGMFFGIAMMRFTDFER